MRLKNLFAILVILAAFVWYVWVLCGAPLPVCSQVVETAVSPSPPVYRVYQNQHTVDIAEYYIYSSGCYLEGKTVDGRKIVFSGTYYLEELSPTTRPGS